jgi:hypothetical protein
MNGYRCTRGDALAAVTVMWNAAWSRENRVRPLWPRGELKRLLKDYSADSFLVLYDSGQAAVAALLTSSDPGLWPDIPPGTAGYVRNLSVRRTCAGHWLALFLLEYAAEICKNEGMRVLRLRCEASLEKQREIFRLVGLTFVGEAQAPIRRRGMVTFALYELPL